MSLKEDKMSMIDYYFDLNDYHYEKYKCSLSVKTSENLLRFLVLFQNGTFFEMYGSEITLSSAYDNSGERVRTAAYLLNLELYSANRGNGQNNKKEIFNNEPGSREYPIAAGFQLEFADTKYFPVLIEHGYTLIIITQKAHKMNLKSGKQRDFILRNVQQILNKSTYFNNPIYLQSLLTSNIMDNNNNNNNSLYTQINEKRYSETMLEQINRPILMCIHLVYIPLTKIYSVGIALFSITTGSVELYENTSTFEEKHLVIDDILRLCQMYNPTHIIWSNGQNDTLNTLNTLRETNPFIYETLENLKNSKGQYIPQIKMNYLKNLNLLQTQEEILKVIYSFKQQQQQLEQNQKNHQNKTITTSIIDFLDLKQNPEARIALCYLIEYIFETNKSLFELFKKPTWITRLKSNNLILEQNAIRELNIQELYQTIYAKLLQTCMGKRVLKERLMFPSCNPEIINQRFQLSEQFEKHAQEVETNKLNNQNKSLKIKTFLEFPVHSCSLYSSLLSLLKKPKIVSPDKIKSFFENRNLNQEIILNQLKKGSQINVAIDFDYLHQRMRMKLLSMNHFQHFFLFLFNISIHAEVYTLQNIKQEFFHFCNDLENVLVSFFNPIYFMKNINNEYQYNLFETKKIFNYLLIKNNNINNKTNHVILDYLYKTETAQKSTDLLETCFQIKNQEQEIIPEHQDMIKSLSNYRKIQSQNLFAPYQKLDTKLKVILTFTPFYSLQQQNLKQVAYTKSNKQPKTILDPDADPDPNPDNDDNNDNDINDINDINDMNDNDDDIVIPGTTLSVQQKDYFNQFRCKTATNSIIETTETTGSITKQNILSPDYEKISILFCQQYQYYFMLHVLYQLFNIVTFKVNNIALNKQKLSVVTKKTKYVINDEKIELLNHKHYGLIWIASKNCIEIFSKMDPFEIETDNEILQNISNDKIELFLQSCYILETNNNSSPTLTLSSESSEMDTAEFIQTYVDHFYNYFLFHYQGSIDYLKEKQKNQTMKNIKTKLANYHFFNNISRRDYATSCSSQSATQFKKTLFEQQTKCLGQKSSIRNNFPKIKSILIHNIYSILFYEIKKLSTKVELQLYNDILFSFANCYSNRITAISDFIAELDIAHASAHCKINNNYTKPIIEKENNTNSNSWFSIKELRHPLVEKNLLNGSIYVPNDFECLNDSPGLVICGINSSGKSCAMRSVGLAIVMAQAGLYVPCTLMKYYPFQNILTRIMGNDSILENKSSYTVEVLECKTIITRSTENTFVMGDEICHGTEILSGTVLVASILDYIASKKTKFIIATHMRALQHACNEKSINFMHLHVEQKPNGQLHFDRKLKTGTGPDTYGLDVAESLGMPFDIIFNARKKLAIMQNQPETLIGKQNKSKHIQEPIGNTMWITTQNKCSLCQEGLAEEEDHIVPRDFATKNIQHLSYIRSPNNLRKICKKCHIQKSNNEKKLKKEMGTIAYYSLEPQKLRDLLLSMEMKSTSSFEPIEQQSNEPIEQQSKEPIEQQSKEPIEQSKEQITALKKRKQQEPIIKTRSTKKQKCVSQQQQTLHSFF